MADVILNENTQEYLRKSSPWVRFFAILWVISCIVLVVFGIVMMIIGIVASPYLPDDLAFIGIMGVLYVVMAGFFIIPMRYLLRCSKALRDFALKDDAEALEPAAKNMKSLLKFCGILSIISIALALVGLVITVIVAVVMASGF
jgi:hypothetical protein